VQEPETPLKSFWEATGGLSAGKDDGSEWKAQAYLRRLVVMIHRAAETRGRKGFPRYLCVVAIEVSLTADGVGVTYESSGIMTGQDLLDADARAYQHIAGNPEIRYVFVDHSAFPEQEVDPESIRVLAHRVSTTLELIPDGIVAIAAPSDVLFGLSRMWQIQAEQPRLVISIARTREEAVAWLEAELAKRDLPFRLKE